MTDKVSLLKGTKWRWRQGLRDMPIHSSLDQDSCRTQELFLHVSDEDKLQGIMGELKRNGIEVSDKITRSPYDVIPQGSLIIYAAKSFKNAAPYEVENMEKLKGYVLSHGGKIEGCGQKTSILSIVKSFFGGRK